MCQMKNRSSCHLNIVDGNDQSHSMRPQRIHHSDDDGDCDSNSANDADVDDDSDDGGKQQRKQVQQQHSSPATKTTRFATTPMRPTASPFVPKSQHQPAARTVLTATAHPFRPSCQAIPVRAKSVAARRRDKGSTASATARPPELSPNDSNTQDSTSSKGLTHSQPSAQPSSDSEDSFSGRQPQT